MLKRTYSAPAAGNEIPAALISAARKEVVSLAMKPHFRESTGVVPRGTRRAGWLEACLPG
jgi:hypothetical protein